MALQQHDLQTIDPRSADIIQSIQQRETYRSIAQRHQISAERVRQIALKHQVVSQNKSGPRPLKPNDIPIAQLVQEQPNRSYTDLAQQLGCTTNKIRRVAAKASSGWVRHPVHQRGIQPWDYIVDEHGCWIWQRMLRKGYGLITVPREGKPIQTYVHRYTYERTFGPIPPRARVRHTCGQKACINQLYDQSPIDNAHKPHSQCNYGSVPEQP